MLVCQWCSDAYAFTASRAADSKMFCSRRCETEARFWLYELLRTPGLPPAKS